MGIKLESSVKKGSILTIATALKNVISQELLK